MSERRTPTDLPKLLTGYHIQTGNIRQRRIAIPLETQVKTDLIIGLGRMYDAMPVMYRASSEGAYSDIQRFINDHNNVVGEIAGNRVSAFQMNGLAHVALIGACANILRNEHEGLENAKIFLSMLNAIVVQKATMQVSARRGDQSNIQVENVNLAYGGVDLQLNLVHIEALGTNLEVIKCLKDQELDPFGR